MTRTIRRRRLEAKTDYKSRLTLLKSEKPRLVVRKTNKYIIAQIVESDVAQDKILFGITSKALLSKGWPEDKSGSLKSLAAAYLAGLMLGKMAKSKVKECILDIGMNRNVKKSRIYAVLKGAIDAGIKIPNDPSSLPSLEDLKKNEKTSKTFEKMVKEI